MRKNCAKVIAAFVAGRPCSTPSIKTDGRTVYSYDLPIARRSIEGSGAVNVLGGKGPTSTTSAHINAAREALALYALTGRVKLEVVGPAFL